MGLPERNPGTGGQKGRARDTLWLQLQTSEAEAGFPDLSCSWFSYSNTEVEGERTGRCTKMNYIIVLDNIHT